MEKKYSNVCYVMTIYSLFLYLLHVEYSQIERTLFILDKGFPLKINNSILDVVYLGDFMHRKDDEYLKYFKMFRLRWVYYWYKRFCLFRKVSRKSRIYTQDHLFFASFLIGRNKYTLIEDGKDVVSFADKYFKSVYQRQQFFAYPLYKILYGPTYLAPMARNKYCESIISSNNCYLPPHLKHIKVEICDIVNRWNEISKKHKDLILKVFDICQEDLEKLREFDAILYTQNFYYYGRLTEEEQLDLYKRIIEKYKDYNLLIKPHPKDKLDYGKIHPKYKIWSKIVPSQLLSLCGIHFNKHITIFSTAVNDLGESEDIDWYGSEVHKKIFEWKGHIAPSVNVNVCSL